MGSRPRSGEHQKIDEEGQLAVVIPPQLDPTMNAAALWVSTMPTTTDGKAKLLLAISSQLPKLSTLINTTIKVTDVILQGVQLTNDETGEIQPAVRSILVSADGQMYAATSDGIRSCLGMIFGLWGKPPWKPPLPLRVRQIETNNGRRYFTLEYAIGD